MSKNNSVRRLDSITAAAAYAGVCTKTIRRWIANGQLAAYRVGPRLIKVDLDDLDTMFQPIGGNAGA